MNAPQDSPLTSAAALAYSVWQTDHLRVALNDQLYAAVTRLNVTAGNLKDLRSGDADEEGVYWLAMNDAVHCLSRAIVELQELLDGATTDR